MLLISPSSYRGDAFSRAARRLEIEVVPVVDLPEQLASERSYGHAIDFRDVQGSAAWIADYHARLPLTAILSVDDSATELAAVASERLGLPANDPRAALAARDKYVMRSMLTAAGIKCPEFHLVEVASDLIELPDGLAYPLVVKPRRLSGSRGVIRADNRRELSAAIERVRAIMQGEGEAHGTSTLLIESYLPGVEVAVEGVIDDGKLDVLAIFDKPDPLEGPFFEETIYVTPSRLPGLVQERIASETSAAAAALGLRNGPIHAELRIHDERAWLLEIAGRSIGGL
jgi:biotin carboxylase